MEEDGLEPARPSLVDGLAPVGRVELEKEDGPVLVLVVTLELVELFRVAVDSVEIRELLLELDLSVDVALSELLVFLVETVVGFAVLVLTDDFALDLSVDVTFSVLVGFFVETVLDFLVVLAGLTTTGTLLFFVVLDTFTELLDLWVVVETGLDEDLTEELLDFRVVVDTGFSVETVELFLEETDDVVTLLELRAVDDILTEEELRAVADVLTEEELRSVLDVFTELVELGLVAKEDFTLLVVDDLLEETEPQVPNAERHPVPQKSDVEPQYPYWEQQLPKADPLQV